MSRAQITRIVPISDQILLLAFRDTQTENHDVKFLLHQLPGLNPRSDPDRFKDFLHKNEDIILKWENTLKIETFDPGEDSVEVTLTLQEGELKEIEAGCADLCITVEQFALALARFFVEPGTREAIHQWYDEIKTRIPSE